MSGDLVRHAALLDVVFLRQSEVLFRSHVTQHAGTVVGGGRRSNAAGDVVVTWKDVGHQWPEHIKRSTVTKRPLQLHVVFDLVEGHVSRTFDHDLHALPPGALSEFAERFEFGQLRAVRRVGKPAGTKAVTDGERDIVLAHDVADVFPQSVGRVLFVVRDHPLGEQRSASAHDADQSILHVLQMSKTDARVNREVVNSLLRLMLQHLQDVVFGEVLDLPADDHRVDRHGSDRNVTVANNGLAAFVEVTAGRQVHHRVGFPPLSPLQLLDFLVGAGRNRRRAHVCVDFRLRRSTDRHRIQLVLQMLNVCWDDHSTGGDFVTNLLGRQMWLPLGNAFHFRTDDPSSSLLQLSDRFESQRRFPGFRFFIVSFKAGVQRPVFGHEIPGRLV